jgi:hypothetical protein
MLHQLRCQYNTVNDDGDVPSTTLGWKCDNCSFVSVIDAPNSCGTCQRESCPPLPSPSITLSQGEQPNVDVPSTAPCWQCNMCSYMNLPGSTVCARCTMTYSDQRRSHSHPLSSPSHGPSQSATAAVRDTVGWDCPRCSFTNHEAIARCEMCDTISPSCGQRVPSAFSSDHVDPDTQAAAEFTSASIVAGALGGAALALLMSSGSRSVAAPSDTSRDSRDGNDRDRSEEQAYQQSSPMGVFDGAMIGAGLGLLAGTFFSTAAAVSAMEGSGQQQQSLHSTAR